MSNINPIIIQNTYQHLNQIENMYYNQADFNEIALQINALSCLNELFKQLNPRIQYKNINNIIDDTSVLHQATHGIVKIIDQIKSHLQALLTEAKQLANY